MASLREACGRNAELAQLLDTPLALTVAVLAYRGRLVDDAAVAELLAGRLDHLWSAYLVEALPRLRSLTARVNSTFSDEDTMRHLRALAQLMEAGGHDAFTVENLNLGWVRTIDAEPTSRVTMGAYIVFALCLTIGLTVYTALELGVGSAIACAVVLGLTALGNTFAAWRVGDVGLSKVETDEFVCRRWRLDLGSAVAAPFPRILVGLAMGLFIGMVGGVDGLLLGLLPGVTAGAVAAVLALPERAASVREREAGRVRSMRTAAARWTLVVRVTTGLVALVVCWRVASALAPVIGSEVRAVAFHVMLAAAGGAWLSGFALSLYGWWSHRAAVRSVLRRGIVPLDVGEFFPYLEEHIIMRRTLTGYSSLHRTLQSHLAGSSGPQPDSEAPTGPLLVTEIRRQMEQEEAELPGPVVSPQTTCADNQVIEPEPAEPVTGLDPQGEAGQENTA